jgi:hypothetical protein
VQPLGKIHPVVPGPRAVLKAVPAATVAVIWVALSTVKLAAAFPLNFTEVAPLRFVPLMTTMVPEAPVAGAKLEMTGALLGGGLFEVALPQAAMTSRSAAATSRRAHCHWRLESLVSTKTL